VEPDRDRVEQEGPRVLVIDDDDLIRAALTRTLRRLGYEVVSASTGEEGIEKVLTAKPAVVLCDLRMPGIGGNATVRLLASSEPAVPVIVMSGQDEIDGLDDLLRAGVLDFLRKPWGARELVAAVARALQVGKRTSA
jgi:DNA-binding NtrC family response regulator